jgi:hypothetical protein
MLTRGDDLPRPGVRIISPFWFVSLLFLVYETEIMTTRQLSHSISLGRSCIRICSEYPMNLSSIADLTSSLGRLGASSRFS